MRKEFDSFIPGIRKTAVSIDAEFISFTFPDENDREFYWIIAEDWRGNQQHWKRQLFGKTWFNSEMFDYINQMLSTEM